VRVACRKCGDALPCVLLLFTFFQPARSDTGKLGSARNWVISERDAFMLYGVVHVFKYGTESWAWVNPVKVKVKSTLCLIN
jgi:hypothetical protein